MATQKKPLQRAWSCTLRPKTTCPVSSRSFANSTVIRSLCGNLIDSSKLMQLTPGGGGGTKRGHTSLEDHQLETRLAPYHSPRIFGVCVCVDKQTASLLSLVKNVRWLHSGQGIVCKSNRRKKQLRAVLQNCLPEQKQTIRRGRLSLRIPNDSTNSFNR